MESTLVLLVWNLIIESQQVTESLGLSEICLLKMISAVWGYILYIYNRSKYRNILTPPPLTKKRIIFICLIDHCLHSCLFRCSFTFYSVSDIYLSFFFWGGGVKIYQAVQNDTQQAFVILDLLPYTSKVYYAHTKALQRYESL